MNLRAPLALALLLATSLSSEADSPLLYEGFDYTVGSTVQGRNGGIGFGGAWTESSSDKDTIQPGSLLYSGVSTSGQSAHSLAPTDFYSELYREMVDIPGTGGTTLWASFLMRKNADGANGEPADYFGLALFATGIDGVFIGDPSETNTFSLGTVGTASTGGEISTIPLVLGSTAFLVVRIDFSSVGNETIRLFVNSNPAAPNLTTPDAIKTDLDFSDLTALGVYAGEDADWSLDEIRIGTSYQAVVPEPGSGALFAAGVLLAGLRRRRA